MKSLRRITFFTIICLILSVSIYTQDINEPGKEKQKSISEPNITDYFENDDLTAVLGVLSAKTGIIIMYPDIIQGKVNCRLYNVPLSKALDIALAPTPYAAKKRGDFYVVTQPVTKDKQYEISGNIGISDVNLAGFPGDVHTDSSGFYNVKVEAGWSGKVRPLRYGCKFEPSFVIYNNIASNRYKQDYSAKVLSESEKR